MKLIIILFIFFVNILSYAKSAKDSTEPMVLYQGKTIAGAYKKYAVGLHAINQPFTDSLDNCETRSSISKIEGVQFSSSGKTLELFRFTDKNNHQWAIPTSIEKLNKFDREAANSLIRVGKTYFIIFQLCGSGGFPDLIELFDLSAIQL